MAKTFEFLKAVFSNDHHSMQQDTVLKTLCCRTERWKIDFSFFKTPFQTNFIWWRLAWISAEDNRWTQFDVGVSNWPVSTNIQINLELHGFLFYAAFYVDRLLRSFSVEVLLLRLFCWGSSVEVRLLRNFLVLQLTVCDWPSGRAAGSSHSATAINLTEPVNFGGDSVRFARLAGHPESGQTKNWAVHWPKKQDDALL